MIKSLRSGKYKLVETKRNTKILYLGNDSFVWIEPAYIGEILVASSNPHKTDCVLSMGNFHIYAVDDEPNISDHIHLELEVAPGAWQGYLLLTGLPDQHKKRARIIPTPEIITDKPRHKHRMEVSPSQVR